MNFKAAVQKAHHWRAATFVAAVDSFFVESEALDNVKCNAHRTNNTQSMFQFILGTLCTNEYQNHQQVL